MIKEGMIDLSKIVIKYLGNIFTSWQINGETVETVADFIFLGFKITADGDCSQKLKDTDSLEGKL